MKIRCFLLISIFFLSLVISPDLIAQDKNKKPRIGLVLSGGGAKGLAHIGVLKVLEEAGIKPDIITGTSMGSIIGSLYSIGYTAEELSEINKEMNWDKLLSDHVELQQVAIEEKPEVNKYLFQIPIKDRKINLPSGLIEGQHLENYFAKLLWPLTSEENYDLLPVPFHCMSVDMISGETIEHKSGNLLQSIRSSMAIPSVFSPVQMDSMLMVDGGVTRNFPVQEAIDMGADVIIGVYVGFQEDVTIEDISSLSDILMRSTALAGIIDARLQFPKVDLLIVPEMKGYSSGDFGKSLKIEELGKEAARKRLKELKALADSLHLKFERIPKIDQPEKILISKIEVEGLQYINENFVISKSGIEGGDRLSHDEIYEAIEYMYGTQHFKKLTYSLKKDKGEGYILVFHVKENPRTKFKLAAFYDDDLGTGLTTNFTLRNVIAPSSRMLFTMNIAENPGGKLELNRLLGKRQRFSSRLSSSTFKFKLPYYEKGKRYGNYNRYNFQTEYGISYSGSLNRHVGANIFYWYNKLEPKADLRIIVPETNFENYKTSEWGYKLFYEHNTTDDIYIPHTGSKLKISFAHVFQSDVKLKQAYGVQENEFFVPAEDQSFGTLNFDYKGYKTFSHFLTLNIGTGLLLNTDDAGISGYTILGGSQFREIANFRNFAGYNLGELYVPNYLLAEAGLNIQLFPKFYLSSMVNVAKLEEKAEDVFSNIGSNHYWGFNAGIKYNSFFGPIQFLLSDNNKDDELRFHFSIGFPF